MLSEPLIRPKAAERAWAHDIMAATDKYFETARKIRRDTYLALPKQPGRYPQVPLVCPNCGVELIDITPPGPRNMESHIPCPKCCPDWKGVKEILTRISARSSLAQDRLKERTRAGELDESWNVPPLYRACTFRGYLPATPSQAAALEFMKHMPEGKKSSTPHMVVLAGPPGTGKTHLASALLNKLRRPRVRTGWVSKQFNFVREVDVVTAWRRAHAPSREEDPAGIVDEVADGGLMVLDDIGVASTTKNWRTILYEILDRRINTDSQVTVVTTNTSSAELEAAYGQRLMSRLMSGRVLKIQGPDHRLMKKL